MRLKIIAGNLIAVLLVGLGSWLYLGGELENALTSEVDAGLGSDRVLFERSFRLSALAFVEQVKDQARESGTVFNSLNDDGRRRSAFTRATRVRDWFRDPARGRAGESPDIVALIDDSGRVLARDQDINRMTGEPLRNAVPIVARALDQGLAGHDAWFKADEGKLMQVAAAPIRNEDGGVIGALFVGYDLSDGLARREGELLGRSVAFLRSEGIYRSNLEPAASTSFQAQLEGPLAGSLTASLDGTTTSPFALELEGQSFVGLMAPLPATPSLDLAFAVLGNRTAATGLVSSLDVILLLMVLALIFVVVYGFVIGTSIMRPLETIEEGILTIINGRTDHRIDVESETFGGLAYRINQLVNMFTGVEETDAEGHASVGGAGAWGGAAAPVTEQTTLPEKRPAAPEVSAEEKALQERLAAEPAEAYADRIHAEYVAAKQAVGEDVSNIPKDKFLGRLEKNAEALQKKHGCRMVRFQVQTKGTQVILRPVIIR